MVHNHRRLSDYPLRRFVVHTNKNEYIVLGTDNIEAGFRAIGLASQVGEELKDVVPCSEDDNRREWTWNDYEEKK